MAFCKSIGSLRILQSFSSAFRRLAEDSCIMTKYSMKNHSDGICKKLASTKVSPTMNASVNQMDKMTDTNNTQASDTDGAALDVKKGLTDGTKAKSTKSKTSARKTVKASKSDKDKEKEKPAQLNEIQVSNDKKSASAAESETNSTDSTKGKSTNTKTGASKTVKTVKSKTNKEKEERLKFGTLQHSEEEKSKDWHDSEMSTTDNKVKGKTTKSKRKTTTTTTKEDEPVPLKEIKTDRYDIQIPEWMEVVLECPSNAKDKIDTEKFLQFKDFIEELEMKSLPSVTTIIKKTEPEEQTKILQQWMKRKTKELGGEEQFAHYRQKLLTRGSSLHTYIEKYLAGERDFEVAPHIEGPWESIQHVLPDVTDVKKTEKVIAHPDLFYKGQIDCLAAYRNDISVIEWKVSSKPKLTLSQTYDYPLQVAAYLGALNRSGVSKRLEVPNLTTGVIVVAYEDGEPATVHVMSERICNKYWGRWKERLFHYWALQYQKMLHVS